MPTKALGTTSNHNILFISPGRLRKAFLFFSFWSLEMKRTKKLRFFSSSSSFDKIDIPVTNLSLNIHIHTHTHTHTHIYIYIYIYIIYIFMRQIVGVFFPSLFLFNWILFFKVFILLETDRHNDMNTSWTTHSVCAFVSEYVHVCVYVCECVCSHVYMLSRGKGLTQR